MIPASSRRSPVYTGTGAVATYSFAFKVFADSDVAVAVADTTGAVSSLTLGANFTVTRNGDQDNFPGGTITLVAGNLATGYYLVILGATAYSQTTQLPNGGAYNASVVERTFDREEIQIQQLLEKSNRGIYGPAVDPNPIGALPTAAARAGKFFAFDALGDPIGASGTGADTALRTDLAASSGSGLLGFVMSGVGAVVRTLLAKLRDFPTVEDFGAVGDGVTDDSAAFTKMATAKSGQIVLLAKSYKVNGLSLAGSTISIKGARKPSANAAFTALENGSILIGNVNIRATSAFLSDFGVDSGTATGLISTTEGLVVDAPAGQRGKQLFAQNLAMLGSSETSATHSLLCEGFDENNIQNVDVALRHYGVVVKGRNARVDDVYGWHMGTTPAFIKSDTPVNAGNVLDGTVQRAVVTNVIHEANASNTTAFAVYVLASTDAVSGVQVANVQSLYGYGAVRIGGGGISSLFIAAAQVTDIRAENGVTALDLFGYTFDVKARGVKALNPSSGNAFQVSGTSSNWTIDGVDLLISDPAIVAVTCASIAGTGSWDHFTVRNPYRTMSIPYVSTVLAGQRFGDVIHAGEGAPSMAANWAGTAASYAPLKVRRIPGTNLVHLSGAASPSAGATSLVCTLPVGFRPLGLVDVQTTNGGSGANSYTRVYTDGSVQVGAFTVGSLVVVSALFPVD